MGPEFVTISVPTGANLGDHTQEHLPREQHLTFANASGTRVLAFGALYAVEDLRRAADELLAAAAHDDELASRLVATHEQLVSRQNKALIF